MQNNSNESKLSYFEDAIILRQKQSLKLATLKQNDEKEKRSMKSQGTSRARPCKYRIAVSTICTICAFIAHRKIPTNITLAVVCKETRVVVLFSINNFSRQGCCSVHTPYLYLGLKSAANFVCRKIWTRLDPAAHVNDVRLTPVRAKAILSPIHKNEAILPRKNTIRAA